MKQLLVVCCALILVACASTDESLEPMELSDFEPTAKLQKVWSTSIGSGQDVRYTQFIPAISGDKIYAADVDGRVYALDRASGKKLWKVKIKEPVSAGVSTAEGLLFVGTYNADVIAISADDGSEKWRTRVSSEVLNVPNSDGNVVAVQTFDGKVSGLDHKTGELLWTYETKPPLLTLRGNAAALIYNGMVYSAFASGKLVALQSQDGVVSWEQRVAIPKGRGDFEKLVDIDGTPLAVGEIIFVASYQGQLMALTRATGRPLWVEPISTYTGLGAGKGNVYVTNAESAVKAYGIGNGERVWQNELLLRRKLTGPTAFSDYVAVADNEDGYLHILKQSDGTLVARRKIDSGGVRSPIVTADNTLYVYSNDGKLVALTVEPLKK